MTRRRWIADRVQGNRAYLLAENAAHLFRVLRVKPGQKFDVAADGVLRLGTVVAASVSEVEFELGPALESAPLLEVSVVLSIFKFDRMEWALEKLTELGVAAIWPVVAERTASHLAKAAEARHERWTKLVREAAQQSRRTSPPQVRAPGELLNAIREFECTRIVLSEVEQEQSLKSVLAAAAPPLALALGPEGGWTEREIEALIASGWKQASLGSTILRAETAAIAAVAVTMAELQTTA